MENRLARPVSARPGPAHIALGAIVAITAAWWALALWPVGDVPHWLERTRLACFGTRDNGLPDAGGWILLVGEPLGMLGVLVAGWGRALRAEWARMATHRGWRVAAAGALLASSGGMAALGARVARASAAEASGPPPRPVAERLDIAAPAISLTDQAGRETSLEDFRGEIVLVTFAYGHCETVCPVIVRALLTARREAGVPGAPLVVITVDPWRDTPDRLATIARGWGLEPGDRLLSGPVAAVQRSLAALGVAPGRNTTNGDIDHAATTLILDREGRIAWRLTGADPAAMADVLRRSR